MSTREGARGFEDASLRGLVIVDDVAAMEHPIIDLLLDAPARHDLEAPDAARLAPFQWSACALIQRNLYDDLLRA